MYNVLIKLIVRDGTMFLLVFLNFINYGKHTKCWQ